MMATIIVHDRPIGQQRHRTGNGHSYTPTATLEAQRRIRQAWVDAGHTMIRGAVAVKVTAYLPRPRTHFGTGRNVLTLRPSAPARPTGKPDVDNLLKLALDALAGEAFDDDASVTFAGVRKEYADGIAPCWAITVLEYEQAEFVIA